MDRSAQDPDYQQRVRGSFARQQMMTTLGIEITDLEPGRIVLEFDHHESFTQQHGFMHGGAIGTLLDSACGYAAFSLMPADAAILTVEYKINLLRPARADRYRATAEVVKPGRTVSVAQGTATPADSDQAIAVMTCTLMSLHDTNIEH